MSNPFDFSDFGAPRTPTGPTSPALPGTPALSGSAAPAAFDPWANQPPPARPRPQPATAAPADALGSTAVDIDATREPFGQLVAAPTGLGVLATAGPPLNWFAVAIALAVGGALIAGLGALSGGMIITAVAGWLLSGPIAIGALAVFNRVDTRRRTDAIYSAPAWTTKLYWVVLALALIGIVISAWRIALWAGTL